jgi:hypothetical protein
MAPRTSAVDDAGEMLPRRGVASPGAQSSKVIRDLYSSAQDHRF